MKWIRLHCYAFAMFCLLFISGLVGWAANRAGWSRTFMYFLSKTVCLSFDELLAWLNFSCAERVTVDTHILIIYCPYLTLICFTRQTVYSKKTGTCSKSVNFIINYCLQALWLFKSVGYSVSTHGICPPLERETVKKVMKTGDLPFVYIISPWSGSERDGRGAWVRMSVWGIVSSLRVYSH